MIKGILIDSGKVLNESAMGSWSYSPNFFEIVGKETFEAISKEKKSIAYKKAWNYINSVSLVQTLLDEEVLFTEYFKILSIELPELNIDDEKIKSLTMDMVYNPEKYVFYSDVAKVLPLLSNHYTMCIVSDAWPSLRNVYQHASLEHFFKQLVISSEIGVTKPNPLMYQKGLEVLQLNPNEVVFVDDSPRNCEGAKKLGITPILLERKWSYRLYYKYVLRVGYTIVNDLKMLEKVLKRMNSNK